MPRTMLAAFLAFTCALQASAADKPVPVSEAASRMTVPEGFRVTLFAGEPDIVQPIAFTFDDRGRMWVLECLSYPKWSQDGKGRDRVIILEDTDGDGTHDRKSVFLDNGVNLSGIELGFGGVWLCSSPNLIFIPVKDDRPAGPPVVVLDGWNVKDTKHNVFNSLGWGPDGWLYGCNGIQAKAWVGKPGTAQKDRTYLDCGVWRYHPTRKVFEAVAHGTTNPWGLDWDDHGQMFITNCVIDHLWHVVPGGHYRRMYGQDANPYVFDLMGPASDHKHWGGGHWTESRADQKSGAVQKAHDDAGGGHAHSGCAIYLGDNFPAEYRNSVFMGNIHGNRLNRDTLHSANGRYVGRHAPDFLHANDPWFRGICVKQGPEGALYVSDWCDTGECHNYDKADTTNGRIFRVTFGSPRSFRGNVAALTDAELVKLQLSRNEWLVRQARRVLQERAATGKPIAATWPEPDDTPGKLRVLWARFVTGSLTPADYAALFKSRQPVIGGWAVLLAADTGTMNADLGAKIMLAVANPTTKGGSDALMRGLASASLRPHGEDAMSFASSVLTKEFSAPNADLEWLRWYAVQKAIAQFPSTIDVYLKHTNSPFLSEQITRYWLSRGPDSALRQDLETVTGLLTTDARLTGRREALLRGILAAFADRRTVAAPKAWEQAYPVLSQDANTSVSALADELALKFGDRRAAVTLAVASANEKLDPARRRRAIELLAPVKPEGFGEFLRSMLADPAVRGAAVRALAAYPDADTPTAILTVYATLTATEKADAVQTLASRPAFAAKLLDAVETGAVAKADVTAFTARQLLALNDRAITAKLEKVWGTVRPASAMRTEQTARLKKLLTPAEINSADFANGRVIYTRSCASCHKLFGEGGDVGPELTGSQRANLDYVLENVLDPSAVVPGEFRMTAFTLADGRVLTGIIRRETKQAVTVRTVNEEVTIPLGEIETRKPTAHSVMPDGLLDVLKENEIRDLIAYLGSPRQVPLPARAK